MKSNNIKFHMPAGLLLALALVAGIASINLASADRTQSAARPAQIAPISRDTSSGMRHPTATPFPIATPAMSLPGERVGQVILQTGLPNPGDPLAKARIANLTAGDMVDWDIALVATDPERYAELELNGIWAVESGVVTLERCRNVLSMPRRVERTQLRVTVGLTVCVSTFLTDATGTQPAVAMARLVSVAPGLARFEARVAPFVSPQAQLPRPTPTLAPPARSAAVPGRP